MSRIKKNVRESRENVMENPTCQRKTKRCRGKNASLKSAVVIIYGLKISGKFEKKNVMGIRG